MQLVTKPSEVQVTGAGNAFAGWFQSVVIGFAPGQRGIVSTTPVESQLSRAADFIPPSSVLHPVSDALFVSRSFNPFLIVFPKPARGALDIAGQSAARSGHDLHRNRGLPAPAPRPTAGPPPPYGQGPRGGGQKNRPP